MEEGSIIRALEKDLPELRESSGGPLLIEPLRDIKIATVTIMVEPDQKLYPRPNKLLAQTLCPLASAEALSLEQQIPAPDLLRKTRMSEMTTAEAVAINGKEDGKMTVGMGAIPVAPAVMAPQAVENAGAIPEAMTPEIATEVEVEAEAEMVEVLVETDHVSPD